MPHAMRWSPRARRRVRCLGLLLDIAGSILLFCSIEIVPYHGLTILVPGRESRADTAIVLSAHPWFVPLGWTCLNAARNQLLHVGISGTFKDHSALAAGGLVKGKEHGQ